MLHSRFVGLAVSAALLLLVSLAPTAQAARSVFAGAWTSFDIPDGSAQTLVVSADSTPTVVYRDSYASASARQGARSTVFVASGIGTIDGDHLDAWYARSGCGAFRFGSWGLPYVYDASTDTLLDGFGITWHRIQ